jgi:hypothetical protein|tara:strand:- start:233 stop:607 length:375 start_codon:yes stop_codon:yes gene_type:complete
MSGMHLLPVFYSTTNTKKRKVRKKTQSLLAAERAHEKYLKKMGIGSRSSVGLEQRSSKPWVTGSSPVESTIPTSKLEFSVCTKKDDTYKREISKQYVIGQAYNKGGCQVLSKQEQKDPATGKRR